MTVRVGVDEPRHQQPPAGVDDLRPRRSRESRRANLTDGVPFNQQVSEGRRQRGAVEQPPAPGQASRLDLPSNVYSPTPDNRVYIEGIRSPHATA